MEYVIYRISSRDPRTMRPTFSKGSEWYPRISEGVDPEDAVVNMFASDTGSLRVAGHRQFLVLPISRATVVEVKPKKEYELQSKSLDEWLEP